MLQCNNARILLALRILFWSFTCLHSLLRCFSPWIWLEFTWCFNRRISETLKLIKNRFIGLTVLKDGKSKGMLLVSESKLDGSWYSTNIEKRTQDKIRCSAECCGKDSVLELRHSATGKERTLLVKPPAAGFTTCYYYCGCSTAIWISEGCFPFYFFFEITSFTINNNQMCVIPPTWWRKYT